MLKITHYAMLTAKKLCQIMLTDIEQFPDNSPALLVNLHFYR